MDPLDSPFGGFGGMRATPPKDSIGSPRLRRLWGPGGPNAFDTSPSTLSARFRPSPPKPPRSKEYSPGSSSLHGLTPRLEATGSLLPQASAEKFHLTPLSAREQASSSGRQLEMSYCASTLRKLHAAVLQSALDLNFGQALERVANAAKALTKCKHAQLFFLEKMEVQPGGLQSSANVRMRLKGKGAQDKVLPCDGLAGICAQENCTLLSNRPHHDARFNPDIDWAPGAGVKTVACAPMTTLAGKVVGVLQCTNKALGGFTDEDLFLLEFLARQAAVTFDLCVKNEARQAQQRKTTAMLRGCVKLAGKSSISELAHKAGLLCKEVCGASQAACFMLQDGDSSLISWTKLNDGKAEVFHEKRVPLKGFLGEMLRGARQGDEDAPGVRQHLGSIYAPIVAEGRPVGIVQARGNRKGQFAEVDEQLLGVLCGMVGALRENITRASAAINADHGQQWPSVAAAVAAVENQMALAVNAQHARLLVFERDTASFWHPREAEGGVETFSRYPADFPLGYVCAHKGLFRHPPRGAQPPPEREAAGVRALAHRFIPRSIPVEALLLVPLLAGERLSGVVLAINKRNASGAFDQAAERTAMTISSPWGRRLEATLNHAAMSRQLLRLSTTLERLPALVGANSAAAGRAALCKYVAELLRAELCWLLFPVKSLDGSPPRAEGDLLAVLAEGREPVRVGAPDTGLAGLALASGEPLISHDARADPRCSQWLSTASGADVRTSLVAPVWSSPRDAGGRTSPAKVVAVLQVSNKVGEADVFSDRDAALLQELCPLAAALLENMQVRSELSEHRATAEASVADRNQLIEEAAALHVAGEAPGLLARVRRMARAVLHAQDCRVFAAAGPRAMFELSEELRADCFFEPRRGLAGHVLETGAAALHRVDAPHPAYDTAVDDRGALPSAALLCVPLLDGLGGGGGAPGAVVGVIVLVNCLRPRGGPDKAFSERDAELMLNLGRHVTSALRTELTAAKLHECAHKIASIPANVAEKRDRLAYLEGALARIVTAERCNFFVRSKHCLRTVDSGIEITLRVDQGYAGRCAGEREVCHVPAVAQDPRYQPALDARPALALRDALFVPVLDNQGEAAVVVELLCKRSGAFDASDVLLAQLVGACARDVVDQHAQLDALEDARARALAMLTSIQYLYPTAPDARPDDMIFAALAQVRVLLRARAKLYLCMLKDGKTQADIWRCYEEPGSVSAVAVGSFAGSALVQVAPVVVPTQALDRAGGAREGEEEQQEEQSARRVPLEEAAAEGGAGGDEAAGAAAGGALEAAGPQTSAFLCQPLMDTAQQKPIGVIEFRRAPGGDGAGAAGVDNFSLVDQELAAQIAALLVAAMVHFSRTHPQPEPDADGAPNGSNALHDDD